MLIVRPNFMISYGRSWRTRRDREGIIGIGRRDDPLPGELGWRINIEFTWDWLPVLWWCPIAQHNSPVVETVIESASWTGRQFQFAGWTWRRSLWINRIDE